jgi:hypothetical protein
MTFFGVMDSCNKCNKTQHEVYETKLVSGKTHLDNVFIYYGQNYGDLKSLL